MATKATHYGLDGKPLTPQVSSPQEQLDASLAQRLAQSGSTDPEYDDLDRREQEIRAAEAQRQQNHLQELIDEKARYKTDPKRERWSRIAAGIGDAITGISGIVGMANGSVAPDPASVSSSEVTDKTYRDRHSRYLDALGKSSELEGRHNQTVLESIKAMRSRKLERDKRKADEARRAYEEAERLHKQSLWPYQQQEAIAKAKNAENIASRNGTIAEYQGSLSQSQIDRNNRTGTSSGGKKGGKQENPLTKKPKVSL